MVGPKTATAPAETGPATTGRVEPPASAASAAAVLFREGEVALPLACYDPVRGELLGEDECLKLIPAGASAYGAGGEELPLGPRASLECPGSGATAVGLAAPRGRAGTGPSTGEARPERGAPGLWVWPKGAGARVELPKTEPDKGALSLPPAERKLLAEAIRAAAPKAPKGFELSQVLALDLDGDGVEDKLYSVLVRRDPKDETYFPFSGMFLANGRSPGVLSLLDRSEYEKLRVTDVFDLDGDKKPELAVEAAYFEGYAVTIVTLAGDKWMILGGWSCGA
jgi:hypothetical protein